ncbi:hypothetical protein [Rhodopirellula bahusiensis]|uniref:hypothetical protein n=1 Tax=Rhodopirellula bahusiensis TaxID=2014065 RepID=UPI0032646D76
MSYRFEAMLEAFSNDQWYAAHMDSEQAAAAMLDRFTRLVRQELELELIEVKAAHC